MQKNAMRQSEIQALNQAIAYFSKKKDTFDKYDASSTLVTYYARGARSGLIVWGAIITVLGLIILTGGKRVLGPACLAFILPGVLMITGGILMKVMNRRNFRRYQQMNFQLSQELYDYYSRYPNCPVGLEYVNPDILQVIMSVLTSGRADTIKESLNLLLQEINQKEYAAYLQSLNAKTNAIACFAAASFFNSLD